MDYKNTPEGRSVQSKYGKILHASRPEPPHNYPRMPMSNRAKIFSPFAALRGYEDEIASEGRDHLKGNRIELSEEGKQALNQTISQLWKGQEITIKYFTDGYYENVAGVLDAVDVINKELLKLLPICWVMLRKIPGTHPIAFRRLTGHGKQLDQPLAFLVFLLAGLQHGSNIL